MTPNDFGPIYVETDLSRFPVEPWNTASNLIFLLIVIVIARKTKLDWRIHPLLVGGLPILLIGFVGGTLFHATRSRSLWLVMDFVPIFLLSVAAALRLWRSVLGNYVRATIALLLAALVPRFLAAALQLPFHYQISVGYSGLALAILLPAFWVSRVQDWRGVSLLCATTASFAAAVFFRSIDRAGVALLPMGTHFLWHLLGGVSVWCLMEFLYRLDLQERRT